MAKSFLQDHLLHLKLRMLIDGPKYLHKDFVGLLKAHQEGQVAAAQWQAARAAGA